MTAAMTGTTYARSDEGLAVGAVLRFAERHPHGEHRAARALEDDELDDDDIVGLCIAYDHGVSADQVAAYKSLGRSRGLALDEVLRFAFRGELARVVQLPKVARRR